MREDEREAELVAVGRDFGVATAREDAGHVEGSTAGDETDHTCSGGACGGVRAAAGGPTEAGRRPPACQPIANSLLYFYCSGYLNFVFLNCALAARPRPLPVRPVPACLLAD